MTEIITLPHSENIIFDFFQKIEKQEIIDKTIGEETINFIENPKTGGRFWIYDKNDNSNPLGWLCLHNGKLYIVNDNNTQNITLLNTNTLEDLENLKNTYDIYYIDKETPDKLQPVSIEDENNIQTDKGVILSFDEIDSKNPNSNLYLCGIYNGEFKEVIEEVIDPKTNEKTTETKKILTGYVNAFYQNGKIFYKGEIVGGFFHGLGTYYYKSGNIYVGEWKDGNMYGQGIYYCNNGDEYVGEWENDNMHGQGVYYYNNGDIYDGKWKDDNMHGQGVYYYNNGDIYDGEWEDDNRHGQGIYYHNNGDTYDGEWEDGNRHGQGICYYNNGDTYDGKWKDDNRHGQGIYYRTITIQQGEFRNKYPYSISSYLREDVTSKTIEEINNKEINPDNKIYTLERDEKNPNIRTLTFYTKNSKIGLNRDIQIHIDENNIATLQTIDGEPTELTKEEINKIKKFFNNIPIEQLYGFDEYLATLYYTTIMNKEEYKDINILMPDLCEYNHKTNKDVEQTIHLINKIPQEKRNGKYIVPCIWLENAHQVNLIIDFDNKIFEIINTGANVDQNVIDGLQQELRSYFKENNWVVYENNMVQQSNGNCVIASNIVATEKVMLEEQVKEYNEKLNRITNIDKQLNDLQHPEKQQQTINQQKEYKEELENNLGLSTKTLTEQEKSQLKELEIQYDTLFNTLEKQNELDHFLELNSLITTEQEKELNEIEIEQEKDKIKKQREILKENYCLLELNRINKLTQEFSNNFKQDPLQYQESCFRVVK